MGIIFPQAYEVWYWLQIQNSEAWQYAINTRCNAYHANDWEMLPIAAAASKRNKAKLVLDLHEYAPLKSMKTSHTGGLKKTFYNICIKKIFSYG